MLAKRLVPSMPVPARLGGSLASELSERAQKLDDAGADELLIDLSEALDGNREGALEVLGKIAGTVSIPVIALGARDLPTAQALIDAGADRLVVRWEADHPWILSASERWGTTSVESLLAAHEACPANARQSCALGAGELMVRVDPARPFDPQALREVSESVSVPIMVAGPFGAPEHARHALLEGRADAVVVPLDQVEAAGGVIELERYLSAAGIVVRGAS